MPMCTLLSSWGIAATLLTNIAPVCNYYPKLNDTLIIIHDSQLIMEVMNIQALNCKSTIVLDVLLLKQLLYPN